MSILRVSIILLILFIVVKMHKTETVKIDKEISPMKVYGIESIGYPMDETLKAFLVEYYGSDGVSNIDYQRYHDTLFTKDFAIENEIDTTNIINSLL